MLSKVVFTDSISFFLHFRTHRGNSAFLLPFIWEAIVLNSNGQKKDFMDTTFDIRYHSINIRALNYLWYHFFNRGKSFSQVLLLSILWFYDICNPYRLFSDGDTGKIYKIKQLIANYDIITFFLFLAYFQIHLLCITWFFLTLKVALCTVLVKVHAFDNLKGDIYLKWINS